MVSIVASTSRSANSLAMCASHIAPRSGTSFGKLWVLGISTFWESSIFIQLSPFYLETAHLHFIGWRPRGLRLPTHCLRDKVDSCADHAKTQKSSENCMRRAPTAVRGCKKLGRATDLEVKTGLTCA